MALPRIVLQEAPSGLDVLFEEIAKYANPAYQLALKEEERADARLQLSQDQYNESVKQNRLTRFREQEQDQLAKDKFGLQEKQFELDSFKNAYNTTKAEIDSNVAFSFPDSESLSKMNIDSLLAQVNTGNAEYDNKIKLRLKKNLQARKDFGTRQEALASTFMNRYNTKNPNLEYPMDMADARMFMKDPKSYQSYLYTNYIKEKPDISSSDANRLTYFSKRLASAETKRTELAQKMALMSQETEEDRGLYAKAQQDLKDLDDDITTFETQASKIIAKGQGGQGGELRDSFGTNLSADYTDPTELTMIKQQAPFIRNEDYDLAFGSEDDTNQVIVDTDVETAKKNISGDNVDNVALNTGEFPTADTLEEGITEKEIRDMLVVAKKKNNKEEINFLERALSGLGSAQAKDKEQAIPANYTDPTELRPVIKGDDNNLRPKISIPSEEEGMLGDLNIDAYPIEEDFSKLPKAPSPTIKSLQSLNIKDSKGEELDISNPAKFQSQLKSIYNAVFRKGARSRLSREEYKRLNQELIRLISTGSMIEPSRDERMSKIIPREIEMFLKNKKQTPSSLIEKLKQNIKWSR